MCHANDMSLCHASWFPMRSTTLLAIFSVACTVFTPVCMALDNRPPEASHTATSAWNHLPFDVHLVFVLLSP